MVTDEMVVEILKLKRAKKGVKLIQYTFKCDRQEAETLLYQEWLEKRAKRVPHNRLVSYAKNHEKELEYAAFSVNQKRWIDIRKEKTKAERLAILDEGMSNEEKAELTEKALPILKYIFKNIDTRNFVKMVLENGKETTKKRFKITDRQFGRKIRDIEKLCAKNRQQINKLIDIKKNQHEVEILKKFIDLIESEEYGEEKFQELINEYYDFIDDFVGQIANIYSPILLVQNWEIANLKDKYKLVNAMYERFEYLKK